MIILINILLICLIVCIFIILYTKKKNKITELQKTNLLLWEIINDKREEIWDLEEKNKKLKEKQDLLVKTKRKQLEVLRKEINRIHREKWINI